MESCVIYARFSSHGQNEQSIEAQVRICKEFAESKGLKTVNIYNDKARTGTNDSRPAFQQMIADSKSGAFKYIIVYMFDRFARNRRDSIMYKEMLKEKYGIKVLSALEPIAEDEGGEFYEMFLDWNAEKYSKRLSKRVKDGLDTSVANGTFCGGYLIYGYKIDYEPITGKPGKFIKRVAINEEEAEIIRYAFREYAKGINKKEIAEELNRQGLRFKGKPFTLKSFDRYLVNPKYTGEFDFGGRHCDNMYPQIIDKETFDKVQKRLQANRYFLCGQVTAREPYLLTGKIFCGHCGTEMVSDGGTSKMGNQHHYYACKKKKKGACDKKRENKDKLELYVTNCVRDFLSDKNNVEIAITDVLNYYNKRTDETNLKSITTKIANVNKEVEQLADAFVKAKSSLLQKTIETKMQEYEQLLNDLYYQQTQLELERGYQITKEDLLCFVEELLKGDPNDKDYQRKIIDNLVYQVYVSDDNTITYFNISGSKTIETLEYEDVKQSAKETLGVQTLSPPSRQKRTVRTLSI
ncbi:MAG: recombinase family protein [Clostridia bacterium]|nr:recombinase family protein [Clostridia bacterium]